MNVAESLLLSALLLLTPAPAPAQLGGDLQAQILYAYQTEDTHILKNLIQDLTTRVKADEDDAPLRYHLAHAEYRRGLLVDYPTNRNARGGSCVFIHVQLPDRTGSGGGVALPEPQLEAVQDFVQDGAVLAILPRPALDRFKGCLPAS